MNSKTDPALARALDHFDVPPLPSGFADRVVAAATAAPGIPAPRPTRDRRGGWARRRTMVVGALAFGLVSASAVASGVFGDLALRIPVISALITPSVHKVAPKPRAAKVRPLATVTPPLIDLPPVPEAAPLADPTPQIIPGLGERPMTRRAFRAERRAIIQAASPAVKAEFADIRQARRNKREAIRARVQAASPDTQAVIKQLRSTRPATPGPESRQAARAERRAIIAAAPPEVRDELKSINAARRARKDDVQNVVRTASPETRALLHDLRAARRAARGRPPQ
jgi:hypothetical protein